MFLVDSIGAFFSPLDKTFYNVTVEDNTFIARAAIPGTKKEDIDVTLNKSERLLKVSTPNFNYEFLVMYDINDDNIETNYENGVLTIKAPLKQEVTKKITVN